MKNYFPMIRAASFFDGIGDRDLQKMLICLDMKIKTFEKGEILLHAGEELRFFGLVLTGSVLIFSEDYWGNRSILAKASSGDLFAEAFACLREYPLTVSVRGESDCTVLFLDAQKLLFPCESSCAFHKQLVRNLVTMLAEKNRLLSEKLLHMSRRTTREKLLSYLSAEAGRAQKNEFEIPFDRQQLADFLCVDRSAMCAELSALKRDKWLDYHKNRFRLYRDE